MDTDPRNLRPLWELSWLWARGAGAESEEEGSRVHTRQLSGEAPGAGTMGPTLAGPRVLERRLENWISRKEEAGSGDGSKEASDAWSLEV